MLATQDRPYPIWKRTLQGHDSKRQRSLGILLVILHCLLNLHQDAELFFDQFESGLTYECFDQMNTVEMMQCQFQVKSPFERLPVFAFLPFGVLSH